MDKRVSLTIVAYKNYDDICTAITSVISNSCITPQIYVVDNSCYDKDNESRCTFKKFVSMFDAVEYIDSGANLGFGQGHNYVLDRLKSEYHIICNPDIVVLNDAISKIVSYIESNADVGMCIPRLIDQYGNLQMVYRKELTIFDMFIRMFCPKLFPKRYASHTLQNMNYEEPFQVPFGQGSFLVIRTALFKRLEGFDDGYFMYLEDADLCKRVNQVSKLVYYPGAEVIHKWEQGSHRNKTLFKHHINSMRYYFKKWGHKWF
jgi:GT2 family glycosyltransferase